MKWNKSINFYITLFSCLLTVHGFFQLSTRGKSAVRHYLSLQDSGKSYDREAWKNGYSSCLKEVDEELGGIFPDDISGTFIRYFGNVVIG